MILMYSEKGGYMNCKTAKEAIRLSEKGWTPVAEKPVVKKAVKKAVKKVVKKAKK